MKRGRAIAARLYVRHPGPDIHSGSRMSRAGERISSHFIFHSPPLLVMGRYSLEDSSMRDFKDDVHALVEGAGI